MKPTIPKCTKQYLDLVVNPISADSPAQVPDLSTDASLISRSQADAAELATIADSNTVGMFFFLREGWSDLKTAYGGSAAGSDDHVSIGYYSVNSTGQLKGTGATSFYEGIAFNNVSDMQDAAASLRLMAGALRILPTIEMVTDTSQRYISFIIGGQLTPMEINAIVSNGTNVVTALKNSPCAETYGNNSGCCARYDPFQDEFLMKYFPGDDLWNYNAYNFNGFRQPCIYAQFSQPLTPLETAPVILHATVWHEFTVQQPSFLYGQPAPIDLGFDKVRAVMSQCNPTYPIVTKGHSFLTFFATIPKFIAIFKTAVEAGTGVYKVIKSATNASKNRKTKQPPKKRKPKQKQQPLPGNRVPKRTRRVRNVRN
jgi:hypothetical protein